MTTLCVHGNAVCLKQGSGVLIRGKSGSGKSDLTLRLISENAQLISDDRTVLYSVDGKLFAKAPSEIKGKLEVRGIGIIDFQNIDDIEIIMVVDLASKKQIERLPEPKTVEILGIILPVIDLYPFEISATVKLRTAFDQIMDRPARSRLIGKHNLLCSGHA